ncbi:hypothetical protein ADIARSV_0917 [Arcticibacter svalbardensis MN12-7]|uniref:DUF4328 domain-containing protein n=1 Tax=Arcticibacter svalbardensis MN12-7 TaxID=1150600 RepID=R9H3Y9_9SPHI|nr:hypothetical protein [Arcticibacter svalbardensis]EOR95904.1 hypothetical protein ADIARSV_0917 [Arcticibacter svalbardensis MN12-7]
MAQIFQAALILLITGSFCYSITKILDHIAEENRLIQPRLIWLLLIPGLNLIWNFVVASKLSLSIKNEMVARDFDITGKPTYIQGLLYAIISLIGVIPTVIILFSARTPEEIIQAAKVIPDNVVIAIEVIGIIQIILFITYWTKISWYKNILENDEKKPNEDN